jgi:hypothetical protein
MSHRAVDVLWIAEDTIALPYPDVPVTAGLYVDVLKKMAMQRPILGDAETPAWKGLGCSAGDTDGLKPLKFQRIC